MTTASNPNQARTFATRLIEQDKVDALLAGSTTASTMAIIPLAEEAEHPADQFRGRGAGRRRRSRNGTSRRRTPT